MSDKLSDYVVTMNSLDAVQKSLLVPRIRGLEQSLQASQRELLAHKENEGDECPLCAAERENEQLRELLLWVNQEASLPDRVRTKLIAALQEVSDE